MTEEIRCSTGRLRSPIQDSTAHPHMRGAAIKGALKKAHPETKTGYSLPWLAVLPLKAVRINTPTHKNKNKNKKKFFGAWNVRTLLDRDASSRPERRTALIARELDKYQIDIAALSETRIAEEGSIAEPKGGYTFFWRGKAKDEDRTHGVGLAMKTSLCRQLPDLSTPVSQRLMKLRFQINPSRHVTVISAYAPPPLPPPSPPLTSSDEANAAYYEELNALVKDVPPSDKLILLGDFNAEVGTDCNSWKGVLGPHGTGKLNSNSTRTSWHREAKLKQY